MSVNIQMFALDTCTSGDAYDTARRFFAICFS